LKKLVAYSKVKEEFNAYIPVELTPNFSEMLDQIAIHEFVFSFSRLLKDLPYNS
jgi:hypothetical protein